MITIKGKKSDKMKRVGLFVGIDKYKNCLSDPRGTVNDAKHAMEAFAAAGFEVEFLQNEEADSNTITFKILSMMDDLSEGDTFVFYFSGFGKAANNNNYLCCANSLTDLNLYDVDAIPLSRLTALTDRVKNLNRFFVFDCSFSQIPSVENQNIKAPLFLTACSPGENAYADPESRQSCFGKAFLKSIQDPSVKSWEDLVKKLEITDSHKPQHASWYGNFSQLNDFPLFEHWKSE